MGHWVNVRPREPCPPCPERCVGGQTGLVILYHLELRGLLIKETREMYQAPGSSPHAVLLVLHSQAHLLSNNCLIMDDVAKLGKKNFIILHFYGFFLLLVVVTFSDWLTPAVHQLNDATSAVQHGKMYLETQRTNSNIYHRMYN